MYDKQHITALNNKTDRKVTHNNKIKYLKIHINTKQHII